MERNEILVWLSRYKEVIRELKKRPGLGTQQRIAEHMLYKRGETISEYGNIRNFKEHKFRDFIGLLVKVFNVNPQYVFEGKGPKFLIREEELAPLQMFTSGQSLDSQIEALEFSISVLDAQLAKLRQDALKDKEKTDQQKPAKKPRRPRGTGPSKEAGPSKEKE